MVDDERLDTQYFLPVRRAEGLSRLPGGVEMTLDGGERLRVDVLRVDVLRLKISREGRFDEAPTCGVVDGGLAALGGSAEFSVEEGAEAVRVVTAAMTLTIGKSPFRLDAHRADGSVVFETAVDVETGGPQTYATLNDEFVVARRCKPADSFYGLGEKTGRFDRKGRDFTLWNTDVLNPNTDGEYRARFPGGDPRGDQKSTEFDPYYVSIPFFYHQPGGHAAMAGFFFDNSRQARVEFSEPHRYRLHFLGGQYTEYVFAGPAMREILGAYTTLTGRMLPPPLWALGHHQCRWHPYTQATLEALGSEYRGRAIPCDVLWLDIDYMDEYRVFTWNREMFPEPQAMLARLGEQRFRVITIIDPGVKFEPGYPIFDEALRDDLLCRTPGGTIYVGQVWPGRTAFPDFSLEETRRWWGGLNASHVQSGLAGIWNDMNEPATGDIPGGAMSFQHGKAPHGDYHNEYGTLMAMGTVEGLLAAMPDRRTFVLTRAGSPGIQRYAANWLGDNCSRWEHLWLSIPMAMGFGVSGQPFVGADVGGFIENTHLELLVRWYQYGALTPFFRNHNCAKQRDQYPWSFGQAVEDLCREAIELRYRLMPYIYTAFLEAAETGAPVQRPLIFENQDDLAARHVDDQYLFGRDLLVAPVYRAGETTRNVYLPAGLWYDQDGEAVRGPRWITADAPLDTLPFFVRGGSVVPMWPEAPASTMGYRPPLIHLHVFLPDMDGEVRSVLHEDDGITFARQDGAFYRTEFCLRRAGDEITLDTTVSGNGFPEFARTAFRLVFHGDVEDDVSVDGAPTALENGGVTLANRGAGFSLRVTAGENQTV